MSAATLHPAILVENIVKRYGDFEAVASITFEVADGEIFGLLGPNGAGKSTLIRMMTTLTPSTSGRVLIAGHDVAREPDAVRRTIGVIPQALTIHPPPKSFHLREALRSSEGRARAQY
jgi:ABC-2 type transport system ATP-binding protein